MKNTTNTVYAIPVVSRAKFERVTGVKISEMCGKLDGLNCITTCKDNNPFCISNCANCVGICGKCFAGKSYKVRKTAKTRHMLNTEILAADVLPVLPDFSNVKTDFIRFNSHGELVNVINAVNYLLIAAATPSKNFGFWTKRPDVLNDAVKELGFRPANISVVISSLFINTPDNINRLRKLYPDAGVNHVFTVYDAENMPANNTVFNCKCGPRACINCGVCYNANNGVDYIAEKLR